MRILFLFCFLIFPVLLFSQEKKIQNLRIDNKYNSSDSIKKISEKIAIIDMCRFITIENDTT
jgi:hypothetical protein